MRKRVVWQLCLCAWVFSGAVTESVSAGSSPALRALVERFLAEHPAAQAAQADLERAEAEARAFGQPLYNPELEFEYENATGMTSRPRDVKSRRWRARCRARVMWPWKRLWVRPSWSSARIGTCCRVTGFP